MSRYRDPQLQVGKITNSCLFSNQIFTIPEDWTPIYITGTGI